MPEGLSPLDSDQQKLIEAICQQFAAAGEFTDSRINECVNAAPVGLQDHVLFELLVEKFGRQFEASETISEVDAQQCFNCPDELVSAARRAAQHKVPTTGQPDAELPDWLGQYQLKQPESLGKGAFGIVGLYRDSQLDRDVAIKVLQSSDSSREAEALLKEARKQAAVKSNSAVAIFAAGQFREGGRQRVWRPAIVMQYASGRTLRQRIDASDNPKWSIDAVQKVFLTICQAMAELHRDNIIHRDLKPANIIYNEHDQPLLADFGLSAAWFAAAPEKPAGTPAYMAPEVARAFTNHQSIEPDRRQDIWSLGVILYELLAGVRPFVGRKRNELWQRIVEGTFAPLETARPDLNCATITPIVRKCLAVDPSRRYQTVSDIVVDPEDARGRVLTQPLDSPAQQPLQGDKQVHVHIYQETKLATPIAPAATGSVGKPESSAAIELPSTRDQQSGSRSSVSADEGFDRRAGALFIGRESEQRLIESVLFETPIKPNETATVVYIYGSPGIGKSFLISRVLHQRRGQLRGPVIRLALERDQDWTLDRMQNVLANRLRVSAGSSVWIELHAALHDGILLVENVDTARIAGTVSQLSEKLNGCRILVSGRWIDDGGVPLEWNVVATRPLDEEQAAEQFQAELSSLGKTSVWTSLADDQRERLIARTGLVPLAIHLASGYLAARFPLDVLLKKLPELSLRDVKDSRYGEPVLRVMYEESLAALKKSLNDRRSGSEQDVTRLMDGFHRLGFASLNGVGRSLAGAIAGLDDFDLAELLDVAGTLHLIERDDTESFD